MEYDSRIFFRDQLRSARNIALKNSEQFIELLFVFERLGFFLGRNQLTNKKLSLSNYLQFIKPIADESVLSQEIPKIHKNYHLPFHEIYQFVNTARNDALHQGAFARHLTIKAIEISLVLEDSLMSNQDEVKDFMVKNPICCATWQPLSFIRQNMLLNSFTFLPFSKKEGSRVTWYFISDYQLAEFFKGNSDHKKEMYKLTLEESLTINSQPIKPIKASIVFPDTKINDLKLKGKPVLIFNRKNKQDLLGILTAFDII